MRKASLSDAFLLIVSKINIIFAALNQLLITLESATTAAEATGTTTAWASATRTASRASRTTTAEEGILTASKEVQTVDDMQHAVAGDGVVFGIGAPHRRDGTAEGGLPVQDVVELQGDGEGLALKESL